MKDDFRPIKTTYKGIKFRSRLEAKWAAMFDHLDWRWEYEPINLAGYIPDFILKFDKPVLAEIKPVFTFEECKEHVAKIDRSGWDKDALIFGSNFYLGNDGFMGPECCYYRQDGVWAPGEFFQCLNCHQVSTFHTAQAYRCIVGGCYDGNAFLGGADIDRIHDSWAKAGNIVRWEP